MNTLQSIVLPCTVWSLLSLVTVHANDMPVQEKPTQTADHSLTLNNDNERCYLVLGKDADNEKKLPLLLEPPCYWVTDEANTVQQHSYPKLDAATTLLIAGTPLVWTDEKKNYQKLPLGVQCSQFLQGVIIQQDEVFVAAETQEAPHCQGLAIDEKAFHQAASIANRYQQQPPQRQLSTLTGTTGDTQKVTDLSKETQQGVEAQTDDSFVSKIQQTIKGLFSSED